MARLSLRMSGFASLALLAIAAPTTAAGSPLERPESLRAYFEGSDAAEIALARSAAPVSISTRAEVLALGPHGYAKVASGSNGFVCIVMRSWGGETGDGEFWNARIRSPACFNPAGARTVLPIYLERSRWVLAGTPRSQIAARTHEAASRRALPVPGVGAMCYMMSRQGYLGDFLAKHPHPHLMFFYAGLAASALGANLPDVPVASDGGGELGITTFFVLVSKWSDGSMAMDARPAPPPR